jgi:hypothetical protein
MKNLWSTLVLEIAYAEWRANPENIYLTRREWACWGVSGAWLRRAFPYSAEQERIWAEKAA